MNRRRMESIKADDQTASPPNHSNKNLTKMWRYLVRDHTKLENLKLTKSPIESVIGIHTTDNILFY